MRLTKTGTEIEIERGVRTVEFERLERNGTPDDSFDLFELLRVSRHKRHRTWQYHRCFRRHFVFSDSKSNRLLPLQPSYDRLIIYRRKMGQVHVFVGPLSVVILVRQIRFAIEISLGKPAFDIMSNTKMQTHKKCFISYSCQSTKHFNSLTLHT